MAAPHFPKLATEQTWSRQGDAYEDDFDGGGCGGVRGLFRVRPGADAHNGYVQLSCTTVVTKAATHTTATPLKTSESTNFALAVTLSATILLVFFVYFVYMGLKRYRIHRQYEIPVPKLSNGANNNPGVHNDPNLPHIPLENIKSPLIKHMRH